MAKLSLLFTSLSIALASFSAWAGGYEKTVGWSARWSSLAGAAGSTVEGADALYFNPAGMVNGAKGELSFNLSPTWSEFKAPNARSIVAGEENKKVEQQTGEKALSPYMGILYNRRLDGGFAVGAGYYAAGGSMVEFKDVDFGANNMADVKSELSITEASLGGAWRYSDNLSFGLAWRMVMAKGEMNSAETRVIPGPVSVPVFVQTNLTDLEASSSGGFRLGAQYMNDDKDFGASFTFRNAIDMELEGKSELLAGGASQTKGDITVANSFPTQFALGFFWKRDEKSAFYQETTFTQYSANEKLEFSGDNLGTIAAKDASITQNWEDQWSLRFGYEFMGMMDMMWRAGYAYTTSVVPEANARSTFSTPGAGHTFTFGSGKELRNGKYAYDVAAEYTFASGEGKNDGGEDTAIVGDYDASAYALHASFKYRF